MLYIVLTVLGCLAISAFCSVTVCTGAAVPSGRRPFEADRGAAVLDGGDSSYLTLSRFHSLHALAGPITHKDSHFCRNQPAQDVFFSYRPPIKFIGAFIWRN